MNEKLEFGTRILCVDETIVQLDGQVKYMPRGTMVTVTGHDPVKGIIIFALGHGRKGRKKGAIRVSLDRWQTVDGALDDAFDGLS